ncbi:cyclophilin-type peptidyl-prolyl cis-trans isomerase, partial [Kipferlia bialata]|eukprot:g8883.t1
MGGSKRRTNRGVVRSADIGLIDANTQDAIGFKLGDQDKDVSTHMQSQLRGRVAGGIVQQALEASKRKRESMRRFDFEVTPEDVKRNKHRRNITASHVSIETMEAARPWSRAVMQPGVIRIETTMGEFRILLDADVAPQGVYNFVELCRRGTYVGTEFHKLNQGKFIQGGDPTGKGTGGDSIFGGYFPDERLAESCFKRGSVAYAPMDGPNSNGTQFIIGMRSVKEMTHTHTVFGHVM